MSIFDKPQLQQDIDYFESSVLKAQDIGILYTVLLNQSYNTLWNLPDERLEELLNYYGSAKIQEIFTNHYNLGTALNASLDASGTDGERVITVRGREISINSETGYITVVPIPVPESSIETIPQTDPEQLELLFG